MPGPFGASLPRREDPDLLTGRVQYTDDIDQPNAVHMAIHRSRHAHARLGSVDVTDAERHPSVLGVFTADDIVDQDGTGHIPGQQSLTAYDSEGVSTKVISELVTPKRPLLATDRVRYQGEPIAVVLAEDRYAAHDAVDRIEVDYERLDAVTDPKSAVGGASPPIHDGAEDNLAFEAEIGNRDDVDRVFANAAHTVETEIGHQRVAPTPIEPRAAIAVPGSPLEIIMSTQIPHTQRDLVSTVLGIQSDSIRVRAPAVGGGFGCKMNDYPAELLTAWCARSIGRPVTWQATRSEEFLSDAHGRGHDTFGELALADDGRILGLRVHTHASLGAYTSGRGPRILTTPFIAMLPGQYNLQPIYARVIGAFTNSAPIGPYRGTSRTRAIMLLERLVWKAARRLDVDPVDIRRRNLVRRDEFPFRSTVGTLYDSGDYERALEKAVAAADYESIRDQQASRTPSERLVGVGIACGIDEGGSSSPETGRIRVDSEGQITAFCGTSDQGQGHGTTFSQIVANALGVSPTDVDLVEGDTDAVTEGGGTYGSRSAFQAGTALEASAVEIVDQARSAVAEEFEVAQEDIMFSDGAFSVRGVPDRSLSLQLAAKRADGFEATTIHASKDQTLPSMTHLAVVEIDPTSGKIDLTRYVAVDDVGEQINPAIVEGQVHGGVVQGIGQALRESIEYDNVGNLVSGTFLDYSIPRAHDLPDLETRELCSPSPSTPLGIKGVGESGTIAAPAAILNAVADALSPNELEPVSLPVSEEQVWRVLDD